MDNAERQSILDQEHLRLLKIGYFIQAGITFLMSAFGLLYVFLGVFLFSFGHATDRSGQPPPEFVGYMFAAIGGFFTLAGATFAILQFLTARALERQNRRVLCLVTAGFACIFIPYGTALGIFTFIVLGRQSVRSLFNGGSLSNTPS